MRSVEEEFTSGPWTGFYTYSGGRRERMDVSLTFREGTVSGAGSDPVGRFMILGRYDAGSNEIHWTKTYTGAHSVFYKGCRDNRGIWGTWEIHPGWTGGFHLWPKGQGEGAVEEAEAEIEAPEAQLAVEELKKRGYTPMKPPRP